LPFATGSRKFGTKFLKKFKTTEFLIRFERVTFAKAPTSQDGVAPLNDADLAGFEPVA